MKKIWIALTLVLFILGCGTQNENLAKGKELIKSDKRRKEERAVREFKLAIQQQDFTTLRNIMKRGRQIGRKHPLPSAGNICSSHIKLKNGSISKGSFLKRFAMTT